MILKYNIKQHKVLFPSPIFIIMIPQTQAQQPTQNSQKFKILFIRHAQSLTNKAVHDFRQSNKIAQYCWQTFTSFDDFNYKVIYNPDYCDCGISQKGQKQCLQAKEKLKDIKVDLVLVSPLQRALQTCQIIFKDRLAQINIIVQPLLAQSLKYSSDISKPITQKQHRFSSYDFTQLNKLGDYWFLKNQTQQNQSLYFQHLSHYPHYSFKQKQKQLSKFMYRTKLRESNENMRVRAGKIKEIIKYYIEQKKYQNIIVLSHFYTIKHLLAKNISKSKEPLDEFHGPNCSIHQEEVEKLFIKVNQN